MVGIETIWLMEQFVKEYDVDMICYEVDKYHTPEGVTDFKTLYRALFDRKSFQKATFSAAHLYEVANKRKWFDPE